MPLRLTPDDQVVQVVVCDVIDTHICHRLVAIRGLLRVKGIGASTSFPPIIIQLPVVMVVNVEFDLLGLGFLAQVEEFGKSPALFVRVVWVRFARFFVQERWHLVTTTLVVASPGEARREFWLWRLVVAV